MHNEPRMLSPARRAQRCRIALLACFVFAAGAGLAHDWVQPGPSRPVLPTAGSHLYDRLAVEAQVQLRRVLE